MSRVRTLTLVAAAYGCGDPSIELAFELPSAATASQFDTGCVTAVQVYLDGANYPDDDDWSFDCIPISPDVDHASYATLATALRGQINVDLPDSGLTGVEIYGYTGPCEADREQDFDLIFHGGAEYTGGDTVTVPMLPSLSCATASMTVRPIDILKLSATKNCAQAAVTTGRIASTTLSSLILVDGLFWWGGLSAGDIVNGVATFNSRSKVAASVLGLLHSVNGTWQSLADRPPPAQQACAMGTEIEVATIPLAVGRSSQEPMKFSQMGGVAYGLVYGATGPIAGATVTVGATQADLAKIVYLDMPVGVENGTGSLVERGGATSTGPSGLFAIYTPGMLDVTITANGKSVLRKLATATDEEPTPPPVAMIVKL